MICRECGRDISDESVFCMYCGTEQDFEELGPEEVFRESDSVSERRRDDLAPGQKESELLTTLSDGRKRRFSDPLTISLICISSVLLIAFLTLLFGRPVWDRMHASSETSTPLNSQFTLEKELQAPPDQPAVVFDVRQVQIGIGERFDLLTVGGDDRSHIGRRPIFAANHSRYLSFRGGRRSHRRSDSPQRSIGCSRRNSHRSSFISARKKKHKPVLG